MDRRTEQRTWDGWTFRESAPLDGAPTRLLVLLHGWTGDENSMWVFANGFPLSTWIIAPRAPYRAKGRKGYSWRQIRPGTWGFPTFPELRPAAEALLTWLDGLMAHRGLQFERFDLMGFSQGAAMAAVLLTIAPRRMGKVALLSGFLPPDTEAYLQPHALAGHHLFMAHGRTDQLVPFDRAEILATALEAAGAEVQFCAHAQGHKLDAACSQIMQRYFNA